MGQALVPGIALMGACGSGLVALASDLPASPFGAHAAGLWPFAGSSHAPGWEGAATPRWADFANSGPGVPTAHLLPLALVVLGVVLLVASWLLLWRAVRAERANLRQVWWVLAAWSAPLLFAAPFASQDVWAYVAQGKAVALGHSSAAPLHVLGHSTWLSGVDPRYLSGASIYGPGAVDLSALFARLSGGHPWIAVELWRLVVVGAVVLCGWGVARVAASRGANAAQAVVAGVINPAVLIVFIAGIHNDAVMVGLVVAGIALAVSKRPWWALCAAAVAVTIKAPAALAVVAIAWWAWSGTWRSRVVALAAGAVLTIASLVVTGLDSGGGFNWLKGASVGTVASNLSPLRLAGTTSSGPVNLLQLVGIVVAVMMVLFVPRNRSWIGSLAVGLTVMALLSANPQPWYLLWALPVVACTLTARVYQRVAILVMTGMVISVELPLGALFWFAGLIALLVTWLRWRDSWRTQAVVQEQAIGTPTLA